MVNLKVIAAVAVVVVLVVAGAGVLLLTKDEKRNEEINLVLGLEAVGSGIYYDPERIDAADLFVTNPDGTVKVFENGNVKYRAAGWNKLIFGSPGVVSIQHFQLKTIVEAYLSSPDWVEGPTKEYRLVAWQQGQDLREGEVGYIITTGAASQILDTKINGESLRIGLTWQPQLVKVVGDTPYDVLVRTNELFPHQTCCVLYANASFVDANPDVSERLIWATLQATDWLNQAKEKGKIDPSDPDYLKLLEIGARVGGPTFTTSELAVAIEDVEYSWGDVNYSPGNPLSGVKSDIASQIDILAPLGTFKNSLSDLGFSNSQEFAERFVDDSLVSSILKNGKDTVPEHSGKYTVKMGLIQGDIHQLPVHIANTVLPGQTESFYSQAGIEITQVGSPTGAGVLAGMKANEVDFGVNAQPSVITDNINNKLTTKG
ncbi:MAG: hypothetical protein LBU30_06165 [Candidatus Methanoplasma sp.]|jgi:ABC-type nitrate/sulfonate/bicarbonate transport system substrate-binding protein|nr:hypothetical protein [Candidatus Methanoplasma sp.]